MRRLCFYALLVSIRFLPAIARADLRAYLDDQTTVAAEADLSKVDPAALEQWLRQVMTAMGVTGGNNPSPADVDRQMTDMKNWLADFSKSGGSHLYLVSTDEIMKDGAAAVIAPVGKSGNAKAMASLLFSGKTDDPTSRPAQNRKNGGPLYSVRAEVLDDGQTVVHGTGGAIEHVRRLQLQPTLRPELAAALTAAEKSGAVAHLLIVPDEQMRKMTMQIIPIQDVKWILVTADVPPMPMLRIAMQATDAKAAAGVKDRLVALLTTIPPQAKLSKKFVELITPSVQGDQVVLALDNDKLMAMAKELQPAVVAARNQAQHVAGASNVRQLLMACHMYMAEHKGQWPDDLKATEKYLGASAAMVMKNPSRPEMNPAFVYVKPAVVPVPRPAETVVVYEAHKDFGAGVNVGFADGHVEFVRDAKRFDQLLGAVVAQ